MSNVFLVPDPRLASSGDFDVLALASTADADPCLARLLVRAAAAKARADAAAARASAAERRERYVEVAALHRSSERQHRSTAALYWSLVQTRMQTAAGDRPAATEVDMALAMAQLIETPSLAYVLVDHAGRTVRSQATDSVSRAGENLELVSGEGPMHDAIHGGQEITGSVSDAAARWAHYGRPMSDLGVRVVRAAPLRCGSLSFGAVCVFDPPGQPDLHRLADALTEVLLDDAGVGQATGDGWSAETGLVLRGADEMSELHQAAGMVVAGVGCDPDTAIALIRARAYAEDVRAVEIARAVLAGRLRLAL